MAGVRMPEDLTELIARPWAVVLLIAAAFMLPLVIADTLRGDGPPRQLARVTTAPAPQAAGPRIPDLRPAVALPRMQTESEPAASDAAEPAPAAPAPAPPAPAPPAPASPEGGP